MTNNETPQPDVVSKLTAAQYDVLRGPLNGSRVESRTQSGQQLSYLAAWDVKAHLTRVFGYGGWSFEVIEAYHVFTEAREVGRQNSPGWEVAWYARGTLQIPQLECAYTEAAVGSFMGSVDLGGLHDNAVKQAASDALKRCAINLGTQFGLSLYQNGNRNDVVKGTLVKPAGWVDPVKSPEQQAKIDRALGGKTPEEPNPDHTETVQA
jgi:hypothetical protein